jgi:hypothetical protein
MDDHDFSYFIILKKKSIHTFTHNLTHLEATPINLKSNFLWRKKKRKKK